MVGAGVPSSVAPFGGEGVRSATCVRVCILPHDNMALSLRTIHRAPPSTKSVAGFRSCSLDAGTYLSHQESEVYSDFRLLVAQGPTRSVRAPEGPATQSRVTGVKMGRQELSHTSPSCLATTAGLIDAHVRDPWQPGLSRPVILPAQWNGLWRRDCYFSPALSLSLHDYFKH